MRVYYVYIVTNPAKSVLYIGMTNDLERRMHEHFENRGTFRSFAGRFFCYNLIYWEEYPTPSDAIAREKQLKKWNRKKKEALIESVNPRWEFYNVFS